MKGILPVDDNTHGGWT